MRSSEKYKIFHKISFLPYFPYKPLFVVVVKKWKPPKIDPIGTIRRNDLFRKSHLFSIYRSENIKIE